VFYQSSDEDTDSPPHKKFRDYTDALKTVPRPIALPSSHPSTSSYLENQPSTSHADHADFMTMIEAVWEARMNAHISDSLGEQEIANNQKLVAMKIRMNAHITHRLADQEIANNKKLVAMETQLLTRMNTNRRSRSQVDIHIPNLSLYITPYVIYT